MKNLLLALPLLGLLAPQQPASAHQLSPTLPASAGLAATRTISGRVTNARGQGLPGVMVQLKGTQTSTRTRADGRYELAGAPVRRVVLVVSFVGYAGQEHTVLAGAMVMNVVLRESHKSPGKLVVSGRTPNATGGKAAGRTKHARRVVVPDQEKLRDKAVTSVIVKGNTYAPMSDLSVLSCEGRAPVANIVENKAYTSDYSAYPAYSYPARPEAGAGDTYAKVILLAN